MCAGKPGGWRGRGDERATLAVALSLSGLITDASSAVTGSTWRLRFDGHLGSRHERVGGGDADAVPQASVLQFHVLGHFVCGGGGQTRDTLSCRDSASTSAPPHPLRAFFFTWAAAVGGRLRHTQDALKLLLEAVRPLQQRLQPVDELCTDDVLRVGWGGVGGRKSPSAIELQQIIPKGAAWDIWPLYDFYGSPLSLRIQRGARNLSVILDSEPSLDSQVTKVVQPCFAQIPPTPPVI